MWVSSTEESMRDAGSGLGHYVIRPRVINEGNEDARDVEVSMIRLRSNDGGKWLIDPLFLPLVLRWSWWPERSHSAGWLPRLLPGTSKHYDLLVVASEQGRRWRTKRRHGSETVGQPETWIAFQTAYDLLDDDSVRHRMRKQPGQYQLDFAVAASNAKTIYRTAHISFGDWRDNGTEMFGKGGSFQIKITETSKDPTTIALSSMWTGSLNTRTRRYLHHYTCASLAKLAAEMRPEEFCLVTCAMAVWHVWI